MIPESKILQRALLSCGLISVSAIAFHATIQTEVLSRVMIPVAALFMGGITVGFPWLIYAVHVGRKNDEGTDFDFGMRLFFWIGVIGWSFAALSMFRLDQDGWEAAVSSVAAIGLAISAMKVLRKRKAPNQPPQPTPVNRRG